MICAQLPWKDSNLLIVAKSILECDYKISYRIPEQCSNLISSLLIADPSMRITAENAKHHPWMASYFLKKEKLFENSQLIKISMLKEAETSNPKQVLKADNHLPKLKQISIARPKLEGQRNSNNLIQTSVRTRFNIGISKQTPRKMKRSLSPFQIINCPKFVINNLSFYLKNRVS